MTPWLTIDEARDCLRHGTGQGIKVAVLDSLHRVEETENGFLHESKDGKVIFEDRDRRKKSPYLTSQVTVSDAPGAGEIVYSKIAQGDPLKQIFNIYDPSLGTAKADQSGRAIAGLQSRSDAANMNWMDNAGRARVLRPGSPRRGPEPHRARH